MIDAIKHSTTSYIRRVKMLDSSKTDGSGLTGLTSASSGLRISTIADNEASATAYTVAGSTIESIATLGTYAAPTATKIRFKEVDATNHPGLYEIQIADARLAVANAKELIISWSGATNLAQGDIRIKLQADDPQVAKPSNFATLSIDGSGRVDVAKVAGTSQTAGDIYARLGAPAGASLAADIAGVQSDTNDIQTRLPAALVSGRMDVSVGAMQSNVLTAAATASDFGAEVADAVWDEALSGHAVSGSTGEALSNASSAGDPWSTAVPGAYSAGSAGYLVGTYLTQATGTLTVAERNSIADALLGRNVGGGSSSGRLVKEALYMLRNKWTSSGGSLTVYEVDDVTVSWTASLTGTAGADPVTGSDPA